MSVSKTVSATRSPSGPAGEEHGAAAFLERAEVRDVLAWMRLLVEPQDAAAVVRALARPPIELRQVDLARVIQVARRHKLDMVAALAAAIDLPQVPPDARERIQRFLELRAAAAKALDAGRPDLLARAVVGVDSEERAGTARPSQKGGGDGDREEALAEDALAQTLRMMREEVLASVARIGGRLGELRLDTDLDISHGVVRYLELLKLSALVQRPAGQSAAEALADVNARLLAATTALQREIFQTSSLDETLLEERTRARGDGFEGGSVGSEDKDGDTDGAEPSEARAQAHAIAARARARAIAPREASSLAPFLPRKGAGLQLSASDIETYRGCPLRYKFARVLRIPTEQTLHQRFGIAVHQVLERYHSDGGQTLEQLLELLETGWRKGGFDDREPERQLHEKARVALRRYHARLQGQDSEPVWFERSFSFRLGPHHLRGRVDRVDRIATSGSGSVDGDRGASGERGGAVDEGAEYELIDYKTSRPKTAAQLQDDIQLSLYALAAREDWRLESSRQAYYYVLDDLKVPVPRGEQDAVSIKDTVLEVGEGILAQAFEPTPSHAACSICDYRIVCPAAER
ncbi:MAG TPA: PD-(D/E)XK nuclease family protein [Solirubrobacteraceae bacterium]|jgi:DNA helicase-2/ATP-dependent DNA helicase PcrA